MKLYKRTVILSIIFTVISFVISLLLDYAASDTSVASNTDYQSYSFWEDISLGVFSGSFLTILTALLSYFHERTKTMENFVYHTRQILHYLNKYQYQKDMPLEKKVEFFLGYIDLDKSAWDSDYGNMDFIFERLTHPRVYIYRSIYQPILQFNNATVNHMWHFRWYLEGSGHNDAAIEEFISELESYLILRTEKFLPKDYDTAGKPKSYLKVSQTEPKLVRKIQEQLSGRYYEIMYGKRKAAKIDEVRKQNG